jgi:hypothetical protein
MSEYTPDWNINLPGVIMTSHKLSFGIVEIRHEEKRVTLDLTNGKGSVEIKGEDAEVLRCAGDYAQSFESQKQQQQKQAVAHG